MKNIYITVLTNESLAANYRGETENGNINALQKVRIRDEVHTIVSSESLRNAFRETLALQGAAVNRQRLNNQGQLTVVFKEKPNDNLVDDFLMGYMIADKKPITRTSVINMNNAIATTPYDGDLTLHQSPHQKSSDGKDRNANSGLLHKQINYCRYEYPVALMGRDFQERPDMLKSALNALAELNMVAGGHARNYFDFGAASLVCRVTQSGTREIPPYLFREFGNNVVESLMKYIGEEDIPGQEIVLAGNIVRDLTDELRVELENRGVTLIRNCQVALRSLAEKT